MRTIKKHPIFVIGLIFLIVGLVFTSVGAITYVASQNFKKTAIEATATITEIESYRRNTRGDRAYNVYISFTTQDGKEIHTRLGYYSSDMSVGQNIKVFYDPQHPQKVEKDFIVLYAVFIGLGLLFLGIGAPITVIRLKKANNIKKLKNSTLKITAYMKEYYRDESLTVNGRHPYIIVCCGDLGGVSCEFLGKGVWAHPSSLENVPLTVYIDPDDHKNYWVDAEPKH